MSSRPVASRFRSQIAGYLLLIPVLSALMVSGCSRVSQPMEISGLTMGTTYSVKWIADRPGIDKNVLQAQVDEVLGRVNASMSTYDEHSELSLFNASPSTDWFEVSPELEAVVRAARQISAESDGAFDVTVGPLVNLWGFGPGAGSDVVPTAEELQAALTRVGYHKLGVRDRPPALKKEIADLYVDLSAIAKGYGVDQVAGLLEALGIQDYLVEIGGELRGSGSKVNGEPWRIAVERPDPEGRAVHRVVPLKNAGMATSGDYRNFFEQGGRRFSHSIDPSTGRPVVHSLASVTVIHGDAMHADALATAILVMGDARGRAFVESRKIAALFILRDGEGFQTHASTAWQLIHEQSQ